MARVFKNLQFSMLCTFWLAAWVFKTSVKRWMSFFKIDGLDQKHNNISLTLNFTPDVKGELFPDESAFCFKSVFCILYFQMNLHFVLNLYFVNLYFVFTDESAFSFPTFVIASSPQSISSVLCYKIWSFVFVEILQLPDSRVMYLELMIIWEKVALKKMLQTSPF